jgi:hypothetical protein
MWARTCAAFAGGALVESAYIDSNNRIIGWHTFFKPQRHFGIDMAGFAMSLQLLMDTN